jgi:hypothetical protein
VNAPVRVRIGVLSLGGVPRRRASAIAESVRDELATLLGAESVQRALLDVAGRLPDGRLAALDAGALPGWSRDRPERAGVRIATRISESLVRPEQPVRRRP